MNDWIEWHGGEYPVPDGTLIDTQYRRGNGHGITDATGCAGGFFWPHIGSATDIMRYRISKPADPPAPDTSAEENRLWHGYAGKALQGLLACPSMTGAHDVFAENAADFADAMLAEAKKRGRV